MAKITNVTLGDHFDKFIKQQLSTSRYGSASEIVRALKHHKNNVILFVKQNIRIYNFMCLAQW